MPLLTLKTNIRAVREHLERFIVEAKKVPNLAIKSKPWLEMASAEATEVLIEIAGTNGWLIPRFVSGIFVFLFSSSEGSGMIWKLERNVEMDWSKVKLTNDMPLAIKDDLWDRIREIISRDLVEDWVAQFKDMDKSRDYRADGTPMEPREITNRVLAMIFGGSEELEQGAKSILFGNTGAHENYLIQSLITRLDELLSVEDIKLWLDAVMKRWRELIFEELPAEIRVRLRAAWASTKVK